MRNARGAHTFSHLFRNLWIALLIAGFGIASAADENLKGPFFHPDQCGRKFHTEASMRAARKRSLRQARKRWEKITGYAAMGFYTLYVISQTVYNRPAEIASVTSSIYLTSPWGQKHILSFVDRQEPNIPLTLAMTQEGGWWSAFGLSKDPKDIQLDCGTPTGEVKALHGNDKDNVEVFRTYSGFPYWHYRVVRSYCAPGENCDRQRSLKYPRVVYTAFQQGILWGEDAVAMCAKPVGYFPFVPTVAAAKDFGTPGRAAAATTAWQRVRSVLWPLW